MAIRVRRDLRGQRFGRLTALYPEHKHFPSGRTEMVWRCRCDCGNERSVVGWFLRHGKQVSCGCYQREQAAIVGRENIKKAHARQKLRLAEHQGRTQSVTAWSKELGINRKTLYAALDRGKTLGEMIERRKGRGA